MAANYGKNEDELMNNENLKEYLKNNAEKGVENLDKIMDDVEDEVNRETHTGIGSAINNIYKSVKNKILGWFK